ncbi:putative apicoplast ribosomal protein L35 precursor [Plasmodium gaboni]|uniref:50S ribosomal protein L35 n=1 Tax=Plasmodium gaboni TaxID=647221 RepID=A0A151LLT0_9APIC|nr:putative apicoplast ribosomal protein L35 precursor [Plasmodium gaboni]KYO00067.1 putative apicoplast ribosomal protein L35 precursor [Plasmodium gaboni]SOV13941.1 apicoplast ribosomal protein L35 precursor, putative [Plasmodium gaboni]SOV22446.1 apicoplast ribosomal protein L35 precursor, putative [Plasmodium sp. DRC-Itaito]
MKCLLFKLFMFIFIPSYTYAIKYKMNKIKCINKIGEMNIYANIKFNMKKKEKDNINKKMNIYNNMIRKKNSLHNNIIPQQLVLFPNNNFLKEIKYFYINHTYNNIIKKKKKENHKSDFILHVRGCTNIKPKTNKSIAKRFKLTKNGKLIRKKPGRNHMLRKKTSSNKASLRKTTTIDSGRIEKKYKSVIFK